MRQLVSITIRPLNASVGDVRRALERLAEEDPTFRVEMNAEDASVTIYGMGELHLEIILDRLKREHNVVIHAESYKIEYVETIRQSAEAEGKFIRQHGGRGQYAHVKVRIEPNPGDEHEFVNEINDDSIPQKFIKAVDEGIKEALERGVLAGYEMVDVKAILYDGSYHQSFSNEIAYRIAASMAVKEAARKASPVLLEPVMSVEVVVPEEFMGTVITDLNARRGRIEGMELRAGSQVICAMVPLSEMFGYATHMRSNTQGRATFSMHFARYEEAPRRGGEGEAGVAANLPKNPKPRSGGAQARLADD